jgi:hypothetical protein
METNFNHKQEEEAQNASTAAGSQSTEGLTFANSDEALRHDREANPPPPEIAERLNKSLANEPKPGTSFWTRLGFKK